MAAYIDDPADTELELAWATLLEKTGSAEGWQYGGSERLDTGWVHCFRNREIEGADGRYSIRASAGWEPEAVNIFQR